MFDTKGHSFDREIIMLNVRWYLSYKLSYADLVEIASERGIEPLNEVLTSISRPSAAGF